MATINDILSKVAEVKPNQYEDAVLAGWLGVIDGKIIDEVFRTHEEPEGGFPEFHAYTENDLGTEMLVPDPYSELYIYYLFAMIDFHNGETARYADSMQMFNYAYSQFCNYYNRTHMPIGAKMRL